MRFRSIPLFALVGSLTLFAEAPPPPAGAPAAAVYPAQKQNLNPNTIQTLDNDFFTSKPKAEKEVSDSGRVLAPEADYNMVQREGWMKECSRYQGKDMKAFRNCYEQAKTKSLEPIKQQRLDTEAKSREQQETPEADLYPPVNPDNGDFPQN